MTLFESVKGTVNTAVDTISTVAQSLVEKNRANAKLNRLRLVMKNESELMNRAYIALGKHCYEDARSGGVTPESEIKKLFGVIESSKAKIAKARDCYRKIVDSQNDVFYGMTEPAEYDSANIVDITVACSNENEYKSSPFENTQASMDTTTEATPDTASTEETPQAAPENAADDTVPETKSTDDESPENELF